MANFKLVFVCAAPTLLGSFVRGSTPVAIVQLKDRLSVNDLTAVTTRSE